MFCSHCGSQLPDNTKFCSNCGAPVLATNNPAPQPQQPVNQQPRQTVNQSPNQQPQQPQQTPKKKSNFFLILIIALGAFLLGKFVLAPAMTSDPTPGDQRETTRQTEDNSVQLPVANPAYDDVFEDTYIIHFQPFFGVDTASFAMKMEDGTICCADYGYDGDMVKQWVETVYLPVSDYSDEQKAQVESAMQAEFAAMDALSCCSVTYHMGASYFTITCSYTDVDQAANCTELYNAGVLDTDTFISMEATETSLLSQGFVKK